MQTKTEGKKGVKFGCNLFQQDDEGLRERVDGWSEMLDEEIEDDSAARCRLDVATVAHASTSDRVTDGVLVAAHVTAAARRAHVQRRHYNTSRRRDVTGAIQTYRRR